jgi:hypothetical protein
MLEYLGLDFTSLKNITIHEINKLWIVKISIEDLNGLEYGKTLFPFTF